MSFMILPVAFTPYCHYANMFRPSPLLLCAARWRARALMPMPRRRPPRYDEFTPPRRVYAMPLRCLLQRLSCALLRALRF